MACKYSGMQFVSKVALDYVASKGDATPADVWPPGGPPDSKGGDVGSSNNFTFGDAAMDGRYECGPKHGDPL